MSKLFEPLTLRSLTLKNRTVVSPMCQYSSRMGLANDWHLVHLGRFALGGFALVIVEASAVEAAGRISYGDLGLWNDAQIEPLKRVVDFLHAQGAAAGIQLAHAGRKASTMPPWQPSPSEAEKPRLGYEEWQPVAPSAAPHAEGWKMPHALSVAEIAALVEAFAQSARRAHEAGFDIVELHGAHGYLVDQFLSPLANKRTDAYGGSLENRMRFALEIVAAVRRVWPQEKPLFMRFSVQDWHADGWQVADSVELARRVKALGVDLVDCSSGGFDGAKIRPAPLYQAPFAEAVRKGADIATMAVGLIGDPHDAEAVLADGKADLVALARPALENPHWPAHAMRALDPAGDVYALYPRQAGYAVRGMDRALSRQ